MLLFPCFGKFGTNIRAEAYTNEVDLLAIGLSHLEESVAELEERVTALEAAIDTEADAETVDAKISELEKAVIDAENAAKVYADSQDAILKNELIAAIESVKKELAGIGNTTTDVEGIKDSVAELDATVAAMTNALNCIKQKTEELEDKNDELQTALIIVGVVSCVTFGGCGAFVIWFFIDRKKRF